MIAPIVFAAIVATAAAAPSTKLPPTATVLPAGFCGGAMVPNVTYTVPAMYDCAKSCKEMNIWALPNKECDTYDFFYCCSNNCAGMPKERTCTVEGKKYTVGQAYEVTLKGECVTMWCLNEEEYVTCKGKECGCKPELTPPPPQVCKKPTPCESCPPIKPQPPKPQPKPQCLLDTDCANQKGCELGCVCSMERCMPSAGFFDPVVPGEEGPNPDNMQGVCTSDADCPAGIFCVNNLCGPPAAPGEGPFPDTMGPVCTSDNDCGPGQFCDSNNQCHDYVLAGSGPEGDVMPAL